MLSAAKDAYRKAKRAFIEKAPEEALRACDSDTAFEQLLNEAQSYSLEIFTRAQVDDSNSGSADPEDPDTWPYNRRLLERTWETKREFAGRRFSKLPMASNEVALAQDPEIEKAISNQAAKILEAGLPPEVDELAKGCCFSACKQLAELWGRSTRPADPVMDVLNQFVKDDFSPNLSKEAGEELAQGVAWLPGGGDVWLHGRPTNAWVGEGQSRRSASDKTKELLLSRDKLFELEPEMMPHIRFAVRKVIHHALMVEQGRLQSVERTTTPETAEERGRRRSSVIYGLWQKAEPPITSCEDWADRANESIDRNTPRDYLSGKTINLRLSNRTALAKPLGINPLDMPS